MKTIYFITGNKGKLVEIQERVKGLQIKIIQKDLGYPEIQTDSLEEVAQFGIKHIQQQFNHSFILEDAGIFIDALKGFPGVYSKYAYYTIGLQGILQLMENTSSRTAVFRSVYAYVEPDTQPVYFQGTCKGTIPYTQQGSSGFGYDPIFIPDGSEKTFAEMTTDEKNRYSHRGKALNKLIDFIQPKRK